MLSLLFWNPILYLFSWLLIALGAWKRWLNGPEIVLSFSLLLIPYVTRAYDMSMASHARFASVVVPQYFVIGCLLSRVPLPVAWGVCTMFGAVLFAWSGLFAANYPFF